MVSAGLHQFAQLSGAFAIAVMVLTVIVHVCFATAVVQDIRRGRQEGRNPWLVGTEVWALATLVGGIFVAATYWLMHHSSLNRHDRSPY
jgi:hypothetical protein